MDELQKGLLEILLAGGKAVSEKGAVEGAKRLFRKLKDILRRDHGIEAVEKLEAGQPTDAVAKELSAQLQAAPAAASSPEVQKAALDVVDALLLEIENATSLRDMLIRNVQGRVSVKNSVAGRDLVVDGVSGGMPKGN
jgi:hypothetical protein